MPLVAQERSQELIERLAVAARSLGLAVGETQRTQLLDYLVLLQRWNAVHNLSAAREAEGLLQQHVLDCLALVGPLVRHAAGRSLSVLDAGTGAGLPAVVLAILLPDWRVTAVDAVAKKVAFVRQVAGELKLANLRPVHGRLEAMGAAGGGFDVVVSRAFSSLRQFVELTSRLLAATGVWVAMKARPSDQELHDLPANCQLFHVEPVVVPGLDAHRCLVWMKPGTKTPEVPAP